MNRDQKAAAIAEIAGAHRESEAIFAVDYRGITVAQVAELRAKLREADATFKVVKNSLTERAADQVGAEALKDYLAGPTALTFVRGDVAMAAKAVADYARATQLLPFKGGLMDGAALDVEQIRALSRLPSREVLYGQLVGVVASPVGGLVRTLERCSAASPWRSARCSEKKESGEIPAGEAPRRGGEAEPPPRPTPRGGARPRRRPPSRGARGGGPAAAEEPRAESPRRAASRAEEPAARRRRGRGEPEAPEDTS